MATVEIILDAQYGSCGKGAFAQWLAGQHDHRPDLAIRTGGPNAGHSVILSDGRRFALRHVPAAAVSARHATLAIPAAGLINPDVLLREVAELDEAGFDVSSRLMIDPLATVIEHEHEALESAGGLREKVGSTREGVGAAQAAKVMRHAKTAADHGPLAPFLAPVFDEVWRHVEDSSRIHIEMTQGIRLSLHYGHYPYATSRDISPAQA